MNDLSAGKNSKSSLSVRFDRSYQKMPELYDGSLLCGCSLSQSKMIYVEYDIVLG